MKEIKVFALSAMLLALCVSVDAQQPRKVQRIGYLTMRSATNEKDQMEALLQGLRELGCTEGKNMVIELRRAAQDSTKDFRN